MRAFIRIMVLAAVGPLSAPTQAENTFGYRAGGTDTPVTGSASASGARGAPQQLERCERPFGTIAVVQPQAHQLASLNRYQLPAPSNLLRLIIQQSNCFQVVERGVAMLNMRQERALADSGELQAGSNIGRGQMVTADFLLTPEVVFSDRNSGGAALGAIGGLLGGWGAVAGAVASGVKFRQAQTTLMLSDTRSGMQVASATGHVEKADWGIGGFLGGLTAGAYTHTAEGKIVAAALLDNYNQIVQSIRGQDSLLMARPSEASARNAAESVQAAAFQAGDVVRGKIAGISVLSAPESSAHPVFKLAHGEELIVLGETRGGYLQVQGSAGTGWVQPQLLRR